ncbi:tRNA pseudouridine(55) synthase TruB [Sphingomonas cavernae]|uniref:tRNA pseudouridine synthase B n=1 Tax=Sphingomonas cavernae TaxID=2320861 RepID=A0A418WQ79_9SPHN|nr:tRNA pseudouridine(55) synthase TruB [Sphingomonas cavernae]RJF93400.1 tRNA pseudouridine(55) synthase TruB [Sphingomonas cavernae]
MHGWIILDKPLGLGSTQAVSAVKRALRQGGYPKVKIGHGGTLDPLASGVLPVALGEATKLAGRMLDSDKIYEFTIGFGVQTDTLDAEGQAIATSDVRPVLSAVKAVLPRFTGPIVQMPPAFSALKVDGKRAYDLARAGEDVVLKARDVTIHALSLCHARESGNPEDASAIPEARLDSRFRGNDNEGLEEITLSAHVSKGTYIRSLARDIAIALGTVGHVTMLRRTKAGPFTLDQAISLDKLAEFSMHRALEDITLPLTAGLDDIPALSVTPDQARLLRQGQVLIGIAAHQGLHLATEAETPVALVEVSGPEMRVVRGFNL